MLGITGVSETLLMTLYCRYLETQRPDAIIKDEKAIELVKKIDFDFSKFNDWTVQSAVAIRSEIIDHVVEEFLQRNPDAIIVSLGAGLCTRFFRLDNSHSQWFELDLPQVKPLWDRLIGESERHKFISSSVLDFSWINVVLQALGNKDSNRVFFIAEGLFMYLTEEEVKRVILEMKNHFPHSEIIMEVLGKFIASHTEFHSLVTRTSAKFKWGVDDCKELETWGIRMIAQWYYSEQHRERQGWLQFLGYIPFFKQQAKLGYFSFAS